ncbi:group II intron reverse transcriptase/maturase [Chitinophaga sp. sic0106]|uniref:group II intron reverse transcriptase/maturase n=1 Tax=Chitinophaga sp. sic0106 TaxID=2854785 RepID=UPI001C48F2FA|nr:group II intron reverse transcriptase/maturase [Chitinophaga sp. sic0106]MBV7534122.1 group II intron reverse transcriptase/maturase [Chitinophaga sp. sic0106]
MLEEILEFRNIQKALQRVISNKGAGGVDGMQTDELRDYLTHHWSDLKSRILSGMYRPSPVRGIEIPKASGGKRLLGIPTVIDRLIQQAIQQWLSPVYEADFSPYSYGFRPHRNAHQAVLQARSHIASGGSWVIELDLSNFFDRVHHDRLISQLSKRISDKRTLDLIRRYLTSGILLGGVVSPRQEGTPQGSPLSPLLSNIVLDELDKELHKRGHKFVRYADDCSIYVNSNKSAHRVLDSMIHYIENVLRLKVNLEKTKISRPGSCQLLGFSFYRNTKGEHRMWIPLSSLDRIQTKIRNLTMRSRPMTLQQRITGLESIIGGWINYFSIADSKKSMQQLDRKVYNRLRICIWKQWKTIPSRYRNLIKLGLSKYNARKWSNTSIGYSRVARSPILCTTLTNAYFRSQGYIGFYERYYLKTECQIKLF